MVTLFCLYKQFLVVIKESKIGNCCQGELLSCHSPLQPTAQRRRRPSATHRSSTATTSSREIPTLESGCTPKPPSSTPRYTMHEFSPWNSQGQSGHCPSVHKSKSSASAAKSCRSDASGSGHTTSDGSKTNHSTTTAESKGNVCKNIYFYQKFVLLRKKIVVALVARCQAIHQGLLT